MQIEEAKDFYDTRVVLEIFEEKVYLLTKFTEPQTAEELRRALKNLKWVRPDLFSAFHFFGAKIKMDWLKSDVGNVRIYRIEWPKKVIRNRTIKEKWLLLKQLFKRPGRS